MTRFRFALLGAGFFSRKWMETVKASEDSELVGIASRSRSVAEGLQRDFGVTGATLYAGIEDGWASHRLGLSSIWAIHNKSSPDLGKKDALTSLKYGSGMERTPGLHDRKPVI